MHGVLPLLRPLQSILLEDGVVGLGRQIISWVPRTRDAARLAWMLELSVVMLDDHDGRAIFLNQRGDVADLHGWTLTQPSRILAPDRAKIVRPSMTAPRHGMLCEGIVEHPAPHRAMRKVCRRPSTCSRVQGSTGQVALAGSTHPISLWARRGRCGAGGADLPISPPAQGHRLPRPPSGSWRAGSRGRAGSRRAARSDRARRSHRSG